MAVGTAFQLRINDIDRTPPGATEDDAAEWDVTWEERIDGVGVASGTVQDRTNSGEAFARERDEIEMLVNGLRVFHGEITRAQLDLPPGRQFPRWKFTASDFNTIPDLRLVGAPDGEDYQTIDGGSTYHPIDPHAHCRATDRLTVEWLFEKYAAMPDGSPIDASTFVRGYVNKFVLYNKYEKPLLWWTNATLRAALDELRGMAGFPIFYWMDPDDAFHWVNFRDFNAGLGALPRLLPRSSTMDDAPAIVTDVTADLDGSHIGGRGLSIEYDSTFMPEQVYVAGVTDFIRGGAVQGSGFANGVIRNISKRQILVDAQATTRAQRDATGRSYLQFNKRGRIKGTVTVGKDDEAVDGWRCGQAIKIIDDRLPSGISGKKFPIQRVSGSLRAGNDFRVYTLEFGDAPLGRFGAKHKTEPQRLHTKTKRIPATEHKIIFPTTHLRPDTAYVLHSQMVDTTGAAFPQVGVSVTWSLVVLSRSGSVTDTGSLGAINVAVNDSTGFRTPNTNITDRHGMTAAELITGPYTDMYYHVRAVSEAQFAVPEGAATT